MKMKKKICICILSLALAYTLTACGVRPPFLFQGNSQMESLLDSLEEADGQASPDSGNVSSLNSSRTASEASPSADTPSRSEDSLDSVSDWYESDDCATVARMLQATYKDTLDFFFEVEEPGIIIYNYQYKEPIGVDKATLQAYFDVELDKGSDTLISSIKNFRTINKVYVTTIRINYLDADGSLLYTKDFTEDYVPGQTSDQSSLSRYDSLEEWLESPEKELILKTSNAQAGDGVIIDFLANGNTLIMDYTYTEQADFSGFTQDEMNDLFKAIVTPEFIEALNSSFRTFETDFKVPLDDIQVIYRNADGTVLYSFYLSDWSD